MAHSLVMLKSLILTIWQSLYWMYCKVLCTRMTSKLYSFSATRCWMSNTPITEIQQSTLKNSGMPNLRQCVRESVRECVNVKVLNYLNYNYLRRLLLCRAFCRAYGFLIVGTVFWISCTLSRIRAVNETGDSTTPSLFQSGTNLGNLWKSFHFWILLARPSKPSFAWAAGLTLFGLGSLRMCTASTTFLQIFCGN